MYLNFFFALSNLCVCVRSDSGECFMGTGQVNAKKLALDKMNLASKP